MQFTDADPALRALAADFVRDAVAHGVTPWLINQLAELRFDSVRLMAAASAPADRLLGVCYRGGLDAPRWVYITEAELGPAALRAVVYHELGHCALDLPHAATGIMAPTAAPIPDWDAAVDQLFEEVK